MKTSRLEAFSDGVLAIIITIMVLELPRPEGHEWASLHDLWPTLFGYVLSFVVVGTYWNNHHHLVGVVERIDGRSMWLNLHLLFWLSLLPYVTGWAGESGFAPVPTACYAAVTLFCAVAFAVLTYSLRACDPDNQVLAQAVGSGVKEKASVVGYVGAVVTPALGEAGVVVSVVLLTVVAAVWIIPDRRIERARALSPSTE